MGDSLSQPLWRSCSPLCGSRGECLTHSEGTLHLPAAVSAGLPEAWTPQHPRGAQSRGLSLGWGMGSGPPGPPDLSPTWQAEQYAVKQWGQRCCQNSEARKNVT